MVYLVVVKTKYPFLLSIASTKHHTIYYFSMLNLASTNNIFYPGNIIET